MQNKTIGIIVAMDEEINLVHPEVKVINASKILGFKFIECAYKNNKLIVCYSQIGKANAAAATSLLLEKFKLDLIVNIGCVGAVNESLEIFDCVIASSFQYVDVDATQFNYELGQIPKELKTFSFNDSLNQKVCEVIQYKNAKLLPIGSADSFVTKDNYKNYFNLKDVYCIDMEATSIAQIIHKTKIDFVSIKFVVDSIYKTITSREQ